MRKLTPEAIDAIVRLQGVDALLCERDVDLFDLIPAEHALILQSEHEVIDDNDQDFREAYEKALVTLATDAVAALISVYQSGKFIVEEASSIGEEAGEQ